MLSIPFTSYQQQCSSVAYDYSSQGAGLFSHSIRTTLAQAQSPSMSLSHAPPGELSDGENSAQGSLSWHPTESPARLLHLHFIAQPLS